MVSRPVDAGGLGFSMKWNMGWMHDTLGYLKRDPIYRRHHQNQLTFGMMYAYTENFILPLSHDEVVHLKHSLLGRMPGDRWLQLAKQYGVYLIVAAREVLAWAGVAHLAAESAPGGGPPLAAAEQLLRQNHLARPAPHRNTSNRRDSTDWSATPALDAFLPGRARSTLVVVLNTPEPRSLCHRRT
jgi:hypothetical protein